MWHNACWLAGCCEPQGWRPDHTFPVPIAPCLALPTIWVTRLPTSLWRAHLLPAAGPSRLGVFTGVVLYDVYSVLWIFLEQAVYGREKYGEDRGFACTNTLQCESKVTVLSTSKVRDWSPTYVHPYVRDLMKFYFASWSPRNTMCVCVCGPHCTH